MPQTYSTDWDLSTIPDSDLYSEIGRRRAAARQTVEGRPPVLSPCPRCGKLLTARERRKACPAHGAPNS